MLMQIHSLSLSLFSCVYRSGTTHIPVSCTGISYNGNSFYRYIICIIVLTYYNVHTLYYLLQEVCFFTNFIIIILVHINRLMCLSMITCCSIYTKQYTCYI